MKRPSESLTRLPPRGTRPAAWQSQLRGRLRIACSAASRTFNCHRPRVARGATEN